MRFIFPVFRFYDCVRKTENYLELKGVYGSRFGVLAGRKVERQSKDMTKRRPFKSYNFTLAR